MSREILFRGKVTEVPKYLKDKTKLGDWVHGSYVDYPVAQIFDIEDEHLVDPATVGQFTGMRNDGGTKTFEGDILEMEGQPPIRVVYYEGMFLGVPLGVEPRYHGDFIPLVEYLSCGYKVIGNIHDTKGEE